MSMLSHNSFHDFINDHSIKMGHVKKVAHNTFARLTPEWVTITLHGSHIITLYDTDLVGVRTCGWPTSTTVDRIRQVLPAGWSVSLRGRDAMARYGKGATPINCFGWLILSPTGHFMYPEVQSGVPVIKTLPGGVAI